MPFLKSFNREWNNNSNFASEKNKQVNLFFLHVMICSVFTESTILWKKMEKKVKKKTSQKLIYLWKPIKPMIF